VSARSVVLLVLVLFASGCGGATAEERAEARRAEDWSQRRGEAWIQFISAYQAAWMKVCTSAYDDRVRNFDHRDDSLEFPDVEGGVGHNVVPTDLPNCTFAPDNPRSAPKAPPANPRAAGRASGREDANVYVVLE
jgi:hypothetical protein